MLAIDVGEDVARLLAEVVRPSFSFAFFRLNGRSRPCLFSPALVAENQHRVLRDVPCSTFRGGNEDAR